MNKPTLKFWTSVTKKVQSWVVPESPFNQIKILLAILFIGGVLVWVLADCLTKSYKEQIALMAIYMVSASLFVIYKTYQYLKQLQKHYEKIQKQ